MPGPIDKTGGIPASNFASEDVTQSLAPADVQGSEEDTQRLNPFDLPPAARRFFDAGERERFARQSSLSRRLSDFLSAPPAPINPRPQSNPIRKYALFVDRAQESDREVREGVLKVRAMHLKQMRLDRTKTPKPFAGLFSGNLKEESRQLTLRRVEAAALWLRAAQHAPLAGQSGEREFDDYFKAAKHFLKAERFNPKTLWNSFKSAKSALQAAQRIEDPEAKSTRAAKAISHLIRVINIFDKAVSTTPKQDANLFTERGLLLLERHYLWGFPAAPTEIHEALDYLETGDPRSSVTVGERAQFLVRRALRLKASAPKRAAKDVQWALGVEDQASPEERWDLLKLLRDFHEQVGDLDAAVRDSMRRELEASRSGEKAEARLDEAFEETNALCRRNRERLDTPELRHLLILVLNRRSVVLAAFANTQTEARTKNHYLKMALRAHELMGALEKKFDASAVQRQAHAAAKGMIEARIAALRGNSDGGSEPSSLAATREEAPAGVGGNQSPEDPDIKASLAFGTPASLSHVASGWARYTSINPLPKEKPRPHVRPQRLPRTRKRLPFIRKAGGRYGNRSAVPRQVRAAIPARPSASALAGLYALRISGLRLPSSARMGMQWSFR